MSKRVLVTGASGMLGSTIVDRWADRFEVLATGGGRFSAPAHWSYRAFDLAAADHRPLVDWARPDVIVHAAALTAVDACEAAPERALDLNGRAVERLRRAAPGARVIYISSDAVFGDRTAPATPDTPTAPINAYGRGKLLGEQLLAAAGGGLTVRTTVVGWNRDPGKQSFVEWLVRSLERRDRVTLFEDALFNPIAAAQLADQLALLVDDAATGVVHVSGREDVSKAAFGLRLCEQLGLDTSLVRVGRSDEIKLAARRSPDQRIDVRAYEQAFGRRLPTVAETIEVLAAGRPAREGAR
jgi:dTDP-4-dehydrorhamnose reductase